MKKLLTKAGLCTLAAGLLISSSSFSILHGAQAGEYGKIVAEAAFWKKNKNAEPKTEKPEAAPGQQKPQNNSQESQKVTPAPKPAETTTPNETSDSSFVRYYHNQGGGTTNHGGGMTNPGGTGGQTNQNQQYQQPQNNANRQNQQQQPGQYQQQNQYHQQNQHQNQQQQQHQQQNQHQQQRNQRGGTDYAPGITHEIHRLLANQPAIQLDPSAYMVQHEDGLWLVMGNIRAKVDILIYVDQKHMLEAEYDGGNAIPLYK